MAKAVYYLNMETILYRENYELNNQVFKKVSVSSWF